MRRRMVGRRRGAPAGMRLSNQRPSGRIQNRTVKIGRMSQFPTIVRVKFIADAQTLMNMAAIDSYATQPVRLIPPGTFLIAGEEWQALGSALNAAAYPPGWITWMNAYRRYRVKGIKVELFPLVRTGDYAKQCILLFKVYASDNSTSSASVGNPQIWSTDPAVKQTVLEPAGNGVVQLNQPAITEYIKPYDVYRRNQDWSTTEATMTGFPSRYLRGTVAILRVSGDASAIEWGMRCRCTFYTELFDRNSEMDSNVTPPEAPEALVKKLIGQGPVEDGVLPIPLFSVDRKTPV